MYNITFFIQPIQTKGKTKQILTPKFKPMYLSKTLYTYVSIHLLSTSTLFHCS